MPVFTSEFPLQPVNDALYASLDNVLSNTDSSPALLTVSKDTQNSNRSTDPQFVHIVGNLMDLGAKNVVIKGGHGKGPAKDIFYDGKQFRELTSPRISTPNTHGTGCTYSAAIAASLAKGEQLEKAVVEAKKFITQAIRKGFPIGSGHSPVHHFYHFWKKF